MYSGVFLLIALNRSWVVLPNTVFGNDISGNPICSSYLYIIVSIERKTNENQLPLYLNEVH